MLKTKRLVLRPWHQEDAEFLYEYAKDPEIGIPAGWPPHTGIENSREVILNVLSAPHTFAVCLNDGKPIGSVGLKLKGSTDMTDRDDECELGYWIGKPYWGQGLIPEACREVLRYAFEDLNMRAIWCGYYEGNEKSRRVQEKLGFAYCYTTHDLDVPLLREKRTGHTSILTKEQWESMSFMKKVKITALRRTCYPDLMEQYENPIEHACDVNIGDVWVSVNGQKPEGFCNAAWEGMAPFVKTLAQGGGNFYDGWMKNPYSAMLSCNDGFRPVSYYLEVMEDNT